MTLWHEVLGLLSPQSSIVCDLLHAGSFHDSITKRSNCHSYERYISRFCQQYVSHRPNHCSDQERFTFSRASHLSLLREIADIRVLGVIWVDVQHGRRSLGKVQDAVNEWGWRRAVGPLNSSLQRRLEESWRSSASIDFDVLSVFKSGKQREVFLPAQWD